jgi:hypothetical protein
MSVRIEKGSIDDPSLLDDGVKKAGRHNILGNRVKMARAATVAGNNRKRKV